MQKSCTLSGAAIIATCIKTSLGRRGQSGRKRCGTFLLVWASCRRGLKLYRPQLQLLLSEGFLECRSAAGRLDVDPVAFYSADKTAIDVVSETASDIRHTLASVGRTDEANLIREVCAAADTIVPLLWNLDTTTDGDVVIDAGSAGRVPADNSADPFIAVCAPVRRLRRRFELALTHLRRRNGPEARVSLGLVVSQLCDLWRRETGRPVTANPVRLRSYTGRPESASGCFVYEAVEALQPTATWIDEHEAVGAHMRAAIMTRPPGDRVRAVHSAMRGYVAADRGDPSVRRRGRPRRNFVNSAGPVCWYDVTMILGPK